MNCNICRTPLQLLSDGQRLNLILTKDEEVEPVEMMECPRCGVELNVHMKEAGVVIMKQPEYRA